MSAYVFPFLIAALKKGGYFKDKSLREKMPLFVILKDDDPGGSALLT